MEEIVITNDGVTVKGTPYRSPAFAAMLRRFGVGSLAIIPRSVDDDPAPSRSFTVKGSATILGSLVGDFEIYFDLEAEGSFQFQLTGTFPELSLRLLQSRQLLPIDGINNVGSLLDPNFSNVEMVFDSEDETLYFGCSESNRSLALFEEVGLSFSRLGFESLRNYRANTSTLYLYAEICIGSSMLDARLDLPVGSALPAHCWVLSAQSGSPLSNGLRDIIQYLEKSQLGQRLQISSFNVVFPEQIHELPSLFLRDARILLDPIQKKLVSLSFHVGTMYPLEIGPLAIRSAGFIFSAAMTASRPQYSLQLYGALQAGKRAKLDVSLLVPFDSQEDWCFELDADFDLSGIDDLTNLPINTDAGDLHLPEAFRKLPDKYLTVKSLRLKLFEINFNPQKKEISAVNLNVVFFAEFGLAHELTISNPALSLQLTDPFNKDKRERVIKGQISGVVTLGEIRFTLTAEKTSEQGRQGWKFGCVNDSGLIPIGVFLDTLVDKFSLPPVPAAIKGMALEELALEFSHWTVKGEDHGAGNALSFKCKGYLPFDESQANRLNVDIQIDIKKDGDTKYEGSVTGNASIGTRQFGFIFQDAVDDSQTESMLVASWENREGEGIHVATELSALTSGKLKAFIPDSLTIQCKDIFFAYHHKGENPSEILFGMDVGSQISMSQLPIVGRLLAGKTLAVENMRLMVVSAATPKADVVAINGLLREKNIAELPPGPVSSGVYLSAVLRIDEKQTPLSVWPADTATPSSTNTGGSPTGSTQTGQTASGSAFWYDVQKQLGPLDLQRVGVGYSEGRVLVLLDATLAIGPLTVSLNGLGAGYNLATKKLDFNLDGLGIDFQRPPLEIGGAFLRLPGADAPEFVGKITIRAKTFSLGGLGAYTERDGHTSMFLYAFLDMPLGGPAFFFVEGLAFGFGLNRRLTMPGIDAVRTFPLVAEVMGKAATKPALTGGKLDDAAVQALTEELQNLQKFVSPQVGEYFLALGVKFNSFKQVDSFAMLAITFGKRFEFDLIGLATLEVPGKIEGQSPAVKPVAHVELALLARFAPQEGFLGIQAQLTPQSYVLSENCQLQGGFAFFSWFGSHKHAGDFVITLGGYAPAEETPYRRGYKKPDHYPDVPRVGFNWQVNEHTHVKALGYFAMTPAQVMAGGALDATWESGRIKAWFSINADFLIEWKPFYYQASATLDVGVDVTIEFFGTRHITVDVGAEVNIWGPEFSGRARIHLWIVSFTVNFGSDSSPPGRILWGDFKKSFLPADDKICHISASHGLVRSLKDDRGEERWIVNAKELCLAIDSAIPVSRPCINDPRNELLPGLTIKPMREALDCQYTVKVTRKDVVASGKDVDCTGEFEFVPIRKQVPQALWKSDRDGEMTEAVTGYTLHPGTAVNPGTSHWILDENLQCDNAIRQLKRSDPLAFTFRKPDNEGWLDKVNLKRPDPRLLSSLGFDSTRDVELRDTLPSAFSGAVSLAETGTLSTVSQD